MATSAKVATGTIASAISSTCDLTVSGFGTPTAALVFISDANATNNPQSGARMSVGFWNASDSRASGFVSNSGVSTTATARQRKDGIAIAMPQASPDDQFFAATAASITDGIRLTSTLTASGGDRYVYAVLFKGTLNTYIGTIELGTGTSAIDVTAPGFKPDLVFFSTIGGSSITNVGFHSIWSLGVAHNNSADSVSQGFVAFASTDNVSTSQTSVHISSTHAVTQHFQDASSWLASISAFDSSGFSITPNVSTGSDVAHYLALELADPDDAYVGIVDSKTSTGTQAYTGTGFTPQALMLWQTLNTSVGITQGSSLSLGATDGSRHRALSIYDRDAQSTTSSASEANLSNPLFIEDNTGATDAIAAYSSFDSNGWTLNFSDGSASARKILAIAIGDSTAGGSTYTLSAPTYVPGSITTTGVTPRVTVTVA